MGSVTLDTAPLVAPRTRAFKTWLSPSLCDMFFLAVIAWSFMTSGTGWSRLLWDGDTAIHIAIGDWILDHHAVPTTDPFSFTHPGAPWIHFDGAREDLFPRLIHASGLTPA